MLLLVDKPSGITSYDVIRVFKRHLAKGTKIGHSGTLDPMATGLLILWTDKDTKRLHEFLGADKRYITTIDFSKMSDTWDMDWRASFAQYSYNDTGILKDGKTIAMPTMEQIQERLKSLVPTALLPLTPFSAKKKQGKKLYEYARAGQQDLMQVEMSVKEWKIISYIFPKLELELTVWSGTYIRSIAYWLGQELGMWGILTQLRRTGIGACSLKDYDLWQEVDGIFYSSIDK